MPSSGLWWCLHPHMHLLTHKDIYHILCKISESHFFSIPSSCHLCHLHWRFWMSVLTQTHQGWGSKSNNKLFLSKSSCLVVTMDILSLSGYSGWVLVQKPWRLFVKTAASIPNSSRNSMQGGPMSWERQEELDRAGYNPVRPVDWFSAVAWE